MANEEVEDGVVEDEGVADEEVADEVKDEEVEDEEVTELQTEVSPTGKVTLPRLVSAGQHVALAISLMYTNPTPLAG